MTDAILEIRGLDVAVRARGEDIAVVDNVTLEVPEGGILGLVGESGCGKSMTLRAVLGLLPKNARITGGQINFRGEDLTTAGARRLRRIRGRQIGMVFQEPMTALNPVMPVGEQISEGAAEDQGWHRPQAREHAIELMQRAGIPDPERRLKAYPHELSGGLRQRVMIAMVLSRNPALILCDEPTTALDVTIQDQILKMLLRLREELGVSLLLVTHDLAVVAETCETVAVMYAGQIVETGRVRDVFRQPCHPYTLGLLRSLPDIDAVSDKLESIPGRPPDPSNPPPGCRFEPRCGLRTEECTHGEFALIRLTEERATACIHHRRLQATDPASKDRGT